MIIYLSLLVCVVGLLMYFVSTNGKVADTGRIMFAAGLLAFLMESVPHLVGVVR